MSTPNSPYDPQPEREDAFGEQARQGFDQVAGDHAEALKRLRTRLQLPVETAPANATIRRLSPKPTPSRRWIAVASGIAAMLVLGILIWNYQDQQQQFAANIPQENTPTSNASQNQQPEASELLSSAVEEETQSATPQQKETTLAATDAVRTSGIVKPTLREQAGIPGTHSSQQANRQDDQLAASNSSPELTPAIADLPLDEDPQIERIVTAKADQESRRKDRVAEASKASKASEASEASKKRTALAATASPMPASPMPDNPTEKLEVAMQDTDENAVFHLERDAEREVVRTVSGTIRNQAGEPVVGAVLVVEETGQEFRSSLYGNFELGLFEGGRVVAVSDGKADVVRFDASKGNQFDVLLSDEAQVLSRVSLHSRQAPLQLIPERAKVFEDFERYLDEALGTQRSNEVVVQFIVSRSGRPKAILAGPAEIDRQELNRAKELLRAGPDWPEAYRKRGWRYTLRL